MQMKKLHYLLLSIIFISSCAVKDIHYGVNAKSVAESAKPAKDSIGYSLYLIGDVGYYPGASAPALNSMKKRIEAEDPKKSGVVFLGDNIYPTGLNAKKSKLRGQDESRLDAQINSVKDFEGDIFFIPGNHDWDQSKKNGETKIKRQEDYVQDKLDGNVFRPSHGCPGPEVVDVSDDLVLIILDTQWWLHQHSKPKGTKDGCDVNNIDELLVAFKEALKKNRSKNIVVVGHHPLISNGEHGGYFPMKDHIFPLTSIKKNLYIPLPILGSAQPIYRKYIGNNQDIAHPIYYEMVTKLRTAMSEYDNVIYAAGHEHTLQYFNEDRTHFIVSGSGSKTSYIRANNRLIFGASKKGYVKLSHYTNGEMFMEYVTVDPVTKKDTICFRNLLYKSEPHTEDVVKNYTKDYSSKKATVTPDPSFAAGKVKKFFFGDLYRDLWATPLEVPYLNINKEEGGLTPEKKGGGMQTISLRLNDKDKNDYVLRGIKKNSKFLIERSLRGTFVQDIIYDGIAGSHPYASVVLAPLARAVNVYHTNPKLVYVPKDSVLGDYLEEFGGMFCLFEERPDDNMRHDASVGYSPEVVSYSDMIENTFEDHNHRIDYQSVLTARLFDMLIGDWDRHDDQWRWAQFKKGKNYIYRPIARDRDQAFFRFDGLFLDFMNSKFLLRKFQPFKPKIKDIVGLNYNARYFDRSNLIQADRADWIAAAEEIKTNITDKKIEEAIALFPKQAYDYSGVEIINTLKARRDQLVQTAERYYEVLAKEVDVTGTLKDDIFEVERLENGDVEVKVYPLDKGDKEKKKIFYQRVFKRGETKEIRLYGLDGDDEYKIKGDVKKSILVRIISGEKAIKVKDKSSVTGLRHFTRVYHFNKKDKIKDGSETGTRVLRDENDHLEYNRKEFVYDKATPGLSLGYNPNDGFYIGPSYTFTKYGFKKEPYKYQHKIAANRTFGAGGYNVYYDFRRVQTIGPLDLHLQAKLNRPIVYQFYGKGNETIGLDDEIDSFNVRMNNLEIAPSLSYSFLRRTGTVKFGLDVRRVSFDETPSVSLQDWETKDQTFGGLSLGFESIVKNGNLNPSRGTHIKLSGAWHRGLSNSPINFFRLATSLSLYVPLAIVKKQTVLAVRTGFERNFGTQAFFQSNFLDGFVNFRGVRRNRYAGDACFYNNFELRQSLFNLRTYAAPFDIGLLAHFDVGKVWETDISSSKFHKSVGAGAFITILDYFMINGTYSVSNPNDSDENNLLTIGTSFLF